MGKEILTLGILKLRKTKFTPIRLLCFKKMLKDVFISI